MTANSNQLERVLIFGSFLLLGVTQAFIPSLYLSLDINAGGAESLFSFGGVVGILISVSYINDGKSPEAFFAGCLLVGLSTLPFGAVAHPLFWGFLKFIGGAGAYIAYSAMIKTTAFTFPKNVGVVLALAGLLYNGGYGLGFGVAPAMIDFLGQRWLLIVAGMSVLLMSKTGIIVMKNKPRQFGEQKIFSLLKTKSLFSSVAGYSIGYIVYGSSVAVLILYLNEKGFSSGQIGLLTGLSIYPAITISVVAGRYLQRYKVNPAVFGFLVLLFTLLAALFSSSSFLFVAFFYAASIFASITFISVSLSMLHKFGDDMFGGGQALVQVFAIAVGGGVAPLMFALSLGAFGVKYAVFTLGALIATAFVFMLGLERRSQK